MNQQIKQRINQLNNGEIPDGYKKTDFGVFPCDWETDKTFGDLFDFYGGLSKSREELGENGHPYLHYGDLHRGSFNKVSFEQYELLPKCDISLTGKETCLMEDGDVAFLDASEDLEGTSRAVLIDNPDNNPFIAGLHIIYGKSKDESITKWYKQYITTADSTKKQFQKLASGFKVYGLNRDTLPRIQVAFPKSTEEQSRIAEILMKWDKAIELQELLIERRETLCARYIELLLTPKAGWIRTALGKVIEEISITTTENNQHEVVSSTKKGLFAQKEYFDKQIASENNVGYKVLRKGNIVLSPQNLWLGNINYNDVFEIGIVSPSYKIFEVKKDFDELFVAALMKTPRMLHQYVLASEQGASVVRRNLNMELFYDIPLFIPSLQEQKRISSVFRKLTDILKLENDKLESMKRQRKVLQSYLLNGIVRV